MITFKGNDMILSKMDTSYLNDRKGKENLYDLGYVSKESYENFLLKVKSKYCDYFNECVKNAFDIFTSGSTGNNSKYYFSISIAGDLKKLSVPYANSIKDLPHTYYGMLVYVFKHDAFTGEKTPMQFDNSEFHSPIGFLEIPIMDDGLAVLINGKRRVVNNTVTADISFTWNENLLAFQGETIRLYIDGKQHTSGAGKAMKGKVNYSQFIEELLSIAFGALPTTVAEDYLGKQHWFTRWVKEEGTITTIVNRNMGDVEERYFNLFSESINESFIDDLKKTLKYDVTLVGSRVYSNGTIKRVTKDNVGMYKREESVLVVSPHETESLLLPEDVIIEHVSAGDFFKGKFVDKEIRNVTLPKGEPITNELVTLMLKNRITRVGDIELVQPFPNVELLESPGFDEEVSLETKAKAILALILFAELRSKPRTSDLDEDFIKRISLIGDILWEQLKDRTYSAMISGRRSINKFLAETFKDLEVGSGHRGIESTLKFIKTGFVKGLSSGKSEEETPTALLEETNPIKALTTTQKTNEGGLVVMDSQRFLTIGKQGRLCPFNTPASKRLGLVNNLTIGVRIEDGYPVVPYFKVERDAKGSYIKPYGQFTYMGSRQEKQFKIVDILTFAEGSQITSDGKLYTSLDKTTLVTGKGLSSDRTDTRVYTLMTVDEVEYTTVSPEQDLSPAACMLPFIGGNEGVRNSYGISLMNQAIPLTNLEVPVVRTSYWNSMLDYDNHLLRNKPDSDSDLTVAIQADLNYQERKGTKTTAVLTITNLKNMLSEFSKKIVEDKTIANEPMGGIIGRGLKRTKKIEKSVVEIKELMPTRFYQKSFTSRHLCNREPKPGETFFKSNFVKDESLAIGVNVLTAVVPYYGMNYEDSLVVSESCSRKFTSVKHSVLQKAIYNEETAEMQKYPLGAKVSTYDYYNQGDKVVELTKGGLKFSGNLSMEIIGEYYKLSDDDKAGFKANLQRQNYDVKQFLTLCEEGREGTVDKLGHTVSSKSAKLIAEGVEGFLVSQGYFVDTVIEDKKVKEVRRPEVNFVKFDPIEIPDKLSDRHGSKGTVSMIVPDSEMLCFKNGVPLELLINPVGIPSRMNIGKQLEGHLGFIAYLLGMRCVSDPFNGGVVEEMKELMKLIWEVANWEPSGNVSEDVMNAWDVYAFDTNADSKYIISPDNPAYAELKSILINRFDFLQKWKECFDSQGNAYLFNPKTGEYLANPVTVLYCYYMKIEHVVSAKIAARGRGRKYTGKLNQPTKGKSNEGGRRIGEMEMVTLLAHGAVNVVNEILNEKSDNRVDQESTAGEVIRTELGDREYLWERENVPQVTNVFSQMLAGLNVDIADITTSNRPKVSGKAIRGRKGK